MKGKPFELTNQMLITIRTIQLDLLISFSVFRSISLCHFDEIHLYTYGGYAYVLLAHTIMWSRRRNWQARSLAPEPGDVTVKRIQ